MNIRDFSKDFLISIFSQDADLATGLKLALTDESVNAQYETLYFSDHSDLLLKTATQPSHILVVDVETLIIPIHDFVDAVLKVSAEIQFIFLTEPQNAQAFKNYKNYNLSLVLERKNKIVFDQVLMAVDLICEKLYRTYQNEQIFSAYQAEKDSHQELLEKTEVQALGATVRPYQNRISVYKLAASKEQLLDQFYQATPTQSWLYLKLIPTIQTLICLSSAHVPEAWSEGLSYKIPQKDKSFIQNLLTGAMPEHLHSYLKNKFGVERIKFLPLVIKQSIEGLLISTQDIDAATAEDFSLMSLVYTQLVYESLPKYLDVEDHLTGFYNELFYRRILDKEIDRSKRTFSPLSVVKIKIDKLLEIEASYGRAITDEIIQKVSVQIKASSRLPDYVCRTAENEFALVLTSCHRKGAALRAERLRQSLEAEKFIKSGLKITISQGISEYPTLTGSIEELNSSATSAMKFISEKGGNKICIYKAQTDHRPDFTVTV